jgi:hypothetical protein
MLRNARKPAAIEQVTAGRPRVHGRRVARKTAAPFSLPRARVAEITKLVKDRHGGLPDTDDNVVYVEHVAWHLVDHCQDLAWSIEQWGYRVGGAKLTHAKIERIVRKVQSRPFRFRADALGKRLGVTDEERTRLGLKTIGACDVCKRQRTARRKAKHRERQRLRRRTQGVRPREQYLAAALSRTKPWEKEGISRRTWERRRKREVDRVSQVCAQSSYYSQDEQTCDSSQREPRHPHEHIIGQPNTAGFASAAR